MIYPSIDLPISRSISLCLDLQLFYTKAVQGLQEWNSLLEELCHGLVDDSSRIFLEPPEALPAFLDTFVDVVVIVVAKLLLEEVFEQDGDDDDDADSDEGDDDADDPNVGAVFEEDRLFLDGGAEVGGLAGGLAVGTRTTAGS